MGKIRLSISSSEFKEGRRLLARIGFFLPVLGLIAAVNISVDPAGLYPKTALKFAAEEYRMARSLAAGGDVTSHQLTDDRLLQKYVVENLTAAPDMVILGSSHSAWMGSNIFSGKVRNHSISSAVLADYLGIFEGYAKRNLYPQRLVLVLDPQLIRFPPPNEKWLSLKEEAFAMQDRLGLRPGKIRKPVVSQAWWNVFSLSYFQYAVGRLQSVLRESRGMGRDISESQVFFKDGRSLWVKEQLLGQDFQGFQGRNEEIFRNIRPDEELGRVLEVFLRYLSKNKVEVTLYLLPLSPKLYEGLKGPHWPGTLDIKGIEDYYKGLAAALHLKITGSYDPAAWGLRNGDFYDEDHVKNDILEEKLKGINAF